MKDNILRRFDLSGGFFGRYKALLREVIIPYQEEVLHDRQSGTERSSAIENFRLAGQAQRGGQPDRGFEGMVFQDSDVYKWLEAAAYHLVAFPDERLEQRCDKVIELIAGAQHEDGYLNTYFTIKQPEDRWTNLQEGHELYCAGHLIEAAVAYAEATGKQRLLDVAKAFSDHIYRRFVTEGQPGHPGHPEVELALMRLYRHTGEKRYLDLAAHFIDVRGTDPDFYVRERALHPWTVWGSNPRDTEYTQSDRPVRELEHATGHAVRAVYLYTGMADLAAHTGDAALLAACQRLWDNITNKQMYITGGIGSCYEGEAFTKDYHLPSDTAYAETCAAIGLIFFARRMLAAEKNSRYGDVMERALYNGVLAGMGEDGVSYFYVNPLEVIPGLSGEAKPHRHALPQRPRWFACACCPPNAARLLSSLAKYAWSLDDDTVYAHLFIEGRLNTGDGELRAETAYPHEGTVRFSFAPRNEVMARDLAVRLPGWSEKTAIEINGKPAQYSVLGGYAMIQGPFRAGDSVEVRFDMKPRRVFANSLVSADSGRVAFMRGPLVYCAEGADNEGDVLRLRADREAEPREAFEKGMAVLQVPGLRLSADDALYSHERPQGRPCLIKLIPYYAWGNRGPGEMRVWIPEE
jgi:DUF1680 family protein